MKTQTAIGNTIQSCLQALGLQFNSASLRNHDDGKLWSYITEIYESRNGRRFAGSGVDFSPQKASIKAIAESIERYFLGVPNQVIHKTQLSQNLHCMPEDGWPTFLDDQIQAAKAGYKKYIIENIDHWAVVQHIGSSEKIAVPASLIWLSSFSDRFSSGISSGTACHFDKKQALLSSIYEVIERDAFTIMWESISLPPSLEIESAPLCEEIRYLLRKLQNKQFAIKVFDITTELNVPVYFVIIYSKLGIQPHISVGAACNLDRLAALSKAIIEAYQTWIWMGDESAKNNTCFTECLSKLNNPPEMMLHPLLYIFKEAREYCDFLLSETQSFNEIIYQTDEKKVDDELLHVLALLQTTGFKAYYLDIGNEITRSFSLAITRVIIPGLVPLSIGLHGKHHANARIRTIPHIMQWQGYKNHLLNPNPHPFP